MREETKTKAMNVLDSVGGFLPYMITLEFPLGFAMLVTFVVKMAGMQSDFITALGFFSCFGLPILWASAFKTILEKMDETQSKWKKWFIGLTVFCILIAILFGVVLVKKFDVILAKM